MVTLVRGSMLWGVLLMLAAVPTAQAQRWSSGGCPGGVCPSPSFAPAAPAQPSYPAWQWVPAKGGYALFRDGRQVGSWVTGDQEYRPYDGAGFGPAAEPPFPPPVDAVRPAVPVPRIIGAGPPETEANAEDWRTHGVAPDRLGPERYSRSGRECSRIAVIEAMVTAGGTLTDDSDRNHLAIIGTDSERAKVLSDLVTNPRLNALRSKLHVQSYPPGHWRVKQYSLPSGILYEAPGGKKIGQWASYEGPDWLADQLEGKKPAPGPGPTPGPANPTTIPLPVLVGAACVAAVVLLLMNLRRTT